MHTKLENKPLVSIIIPTYNRAYTLNITIESVLKQTYKNFEIIVVDDGSTDDTKNVVATFGNKIFFIQKSHTGQADTRNRGLKYAKGDLIASLDSDDIWQDNFLEKSVDYMLRHRLDMFGANWKPLIELQRKENPINSFFRNKGYMDGDLYIFNDDEFKQNTLIDPIIPSSGIVIKASCMYFGWNPKVCIGDDAFLQLEIAFKNPHCRIGLTKEVLWKKNRDGSNICDGKEGIRFRKQHLQDLNLLLDTFSTYLTSNEKELILQKILQNKMLISWHLFLEAKFEVRLMKEIITSPILPKSLKAGIKKVSTRKLGEFKMSNLTKYLFNGKSSRFSYYTYLQSSSRCSKRYRKCSESNV